MSNKKLAITLSPSTQPENHCLICGSEEAHCNHLASLIQGYLYHYTGVACHIIQPQHPHLSTSQKLTNIVKEANTMYDEFKSKGYQTILHIPLHTNAFKGTSKGHLILHYPSNSQMAKLAKEFRNALGLARIATRTDLYELKATKASTLYLETHFHDNPEDATQLHESLPFLASLIATQLLKYGNKK